MNTPDNNPNPANGHQAAQETAEDYRKEQIIVFTLGEEEYGLRIDQIQEVVQTPRVTSVPLTPEYVRGVANVRGQILAIVDLERRFGISEGIPVNEEERNYTLVVESEELSMGLLVREVPNTLSVSEKAIDQSPNILKDASLNRDYIQGIIKMEERLVILVDVMKVIEKEEVQASVTNQ